MRNYEFLLKQYLKVSNFKEVDLKNIPFDFSIV